MPMIEQPNATTLDTELNVDPGKGIVEISQRSDRFALHPQKVTLPFQAILVLAAQIIMFQNGGQQMAGPNGGESRSAVQ